MFNKGTKAHSIAHLKCPRCQEGDLFETDTFSFQKSFDMPENCPVCGQKYFLGPGFYYGAMFISYGIIGWFAVIFVGGFTLFTEVPWETAFGIMLVIVAILFVWFFRVSRAVWINLNVKYDPNSVKQ